MKAAGLIVGLVLLAFGLLFAGQGSGLIMWPASSFMLAARVWVVYGLGIAAVGAALLWWSRRR
ncbi:hypothetical protein [Sphingomonas sp. HMP6]|uniref:hypothetical protein n=1 Tax=Sphingomonas sp. HMP6 TaxID=1517551 RepID=UPI0015969BA9|nr:hypothetical protein [Sphingomonas sp. HMP6]BCA57574.1 membrane protein [Sphingomonas sp. HMP6]